MLDRSSILPVANDDVQRPGRLFAGSAAPVEVMAPRRRSAPVVFSSPHSGRDYPASFVASSGLDLDTLRRSEDSFVDLLFQAVPDFGASLVKANFPRAFVDANREPFELDPEMFSDALPDHVNANSPRVAAGLGTIARVVAKGVEIYRDKMPFAQAAARINDYYRPYHAALAREVAETRAQFGTCIVVDCHSMPSFGPEHGGAMQCGPADRDGRGFSGQGIDIVLGDAKGRSCAGALTDMVDGVLTQAGYAVRRNVPYPGGHITYRYGRPDEGLHSLQIEINRALYMDERQFALRRGWSQVAADMAGLAERLCGLDAASLTGLGRAQGEPRDIAEPSANYTEKRAAT
ncbi:MAG: N-formylglutamate amidohydrolase [Alphaproteobacteria bacterium]|nr:N-formylglutamate amidohydrolase [Alphaproteobacteria bacterium]